ncbi:hypothetical protein JIN85_15415 [Luteolibacter pohnpeiensis]|uniref:DUF4175 family protein n=1 Tax=Luteolibacter pohnpeiensis TaxID=454153 RepID=A0A934VWZ7_9BACT|nr:hypothetical protein [Luteolibacter pohnpeiensis]MBK1883805.1 hypothetical protein [Luteolibacter pohnpeiensis]
MPDPSAPLESTVAIPESLRKQLEEFRRDLWRVKVLEAIIAGLIGLLASFLLVFVLDRFWTTPGWARLVILISGTSLFAIFAPFWLHRWVWRHRRETQLARLIARRYPGLGDRLLGVIELQGQTGNEDSLSPRLRAAAMEAVAAEAGRRKLRDALPPQRYRRWGWIAMVLVIATGAVLVIAPRAGWNAFQRWAMPLSDTDRYTFTVLDHPPKSLAVPFGESFEVILHLAESSERKPAVADARYGLQPMISAKLDHHAYRFSFPGQQEPGTVVFRVGDVKHLLRVEPVQRPSIMSTTVQVTPPAYLQIPTSESDLSSGTISVVEGSRLKFILKSNRALAAATYGPTVASGSQDSGKFQSESGSLSLKGDASTTPEFTIGKVPFEIPFEWTDQLGLSGAEGFKLRVDALQDVAPTAYLQGIDRQKVMLPEETVDFEVLTEDDFGVKACGLEWQGEFTKPAPGSPAKGEMLLAKGAPTNRRLSKTASFSPAAFGISPQKISLRAFVEDYYPERGRVYSEPVTIYVLTREEHAQLLKSQFDRTISGLEDLARKELGNYEENQRLDRQDGSKLQEEENHKRIETQEQAEAENTRRMKELTETMEKLFKDSTRNGEIDKETMKKMAEAMKLMQELSSKDMPDVQQKLQDAGDASNTEEKTKQDMQEAVEQQKKVVEKMQEAVEKGSDASKNLEAGTFVSRLKKAASEQDGIARSLIDRFSEVLGEAKPDLDPADSRSLDLAVQQQLSTASDVRWIREDLENYFARTEKPVFKEIADAMNETQIDMGLEEVRSRLVANYSFRATEGAKKWSDQLTAWAKKLDDEIKKDQGGGGGDGAGGSSEDEDFEFMLRVMKMVQQEQDLRARTRTLEQLKRSLEVEKEPTQP